MKKITLIVSIAALSIWLSACGGGSTNSAANTSPSTAGNNPATGAQNPGAGSGSMSGGSSGSSGSGGSTGGTSGGGSSTAALAYVAGGNQNFFGIRVDSSSTISTVSGSPYSLQGNLLGLAATGNLLFASSGSTAAESITSYRADENGALTPIAKTPVGSSGGASIALDSTGKFLYGVSTAGDNGGTVPAIFGFSVDQSSGSLTPLAGSPWKITQASDTSVPSKPAVTANGAWLCLDMSLARTNEAAQCFPRHADGSIDPNNYVQPAVSNTGIDGLALTSDNSHLLYTEGASNQVFSSQISGTQNGSPVSSQGTLPEGMAVDPSGHWVAVVNHDSSNVAIFSVGVGDILAAAGTATTAANPAQVSFSHSGNYLFVTTTGGTVVYQFNSTTGAATPLNASNPAPGIDGAIATM